MCRSFELKKPLPSHNLYNVIYGTVIVIYTIEYYDKGLVKIDGPDAFDFNLIVFLIVFNCLCLAENKYSVLVWP